MKKNTKRYDEYPPITKKKALGLIVPLCLFSILISSLVISVANDMYAFVKPDTDIVFTVDSPLSPKELSHMLMKKGVIKNDIAFLLYLDSKGKSDKVDLILGEWTLNSNMSYREILLEIF